MNKFKWMLVETFWAEDCGGYLKVQKHGKFGLFNKDGIEVLPAIFDEIYFQQEYFIVKIGKKYGAYDLSGKVVMNVEYDNVDYMGWNFKLFKVKKDGKMGVAKHTKLQMYSPDKKLDLKDDMASFIIPIEHNSLKLYSDYIITEDNNKYRIWNLQGEALSAYEYEDINMYIHYTVVKRDGEWEVFKPSI